MIIPAMNGPESGRRSARCRMDDGKVITFRPGSTIPVIDCPGVTAHGNGHFYEFIVLEVNIDFPGTRNGQKKSQGQDQKSDNSGKLS